MNDSACGLAELQPWVSQPGDISHDRGLFYGDGLFETILLVDRQPRLYARHLRRLQRSCLALSIDYPASLEGDVARGLNECGFEHGVLKIVVSRCAAGRGYAASPAAGSNAHVFIYPGPEYSAPVPGLVIGLCDTRLGIQPKLAGHKHLNRLEQVVARSEWSHPDLHEALMQDAEGYLVEGCASNLFLVRGGQLFTPPIDRCGVAGVMREWVMDCAGKLGIPCTEQRLELADLQTADEMFLTSALRGVASAHQFVGRVDRLADQAVIPAARAVTVVPADEPDVTRRFASHEVAGRLQAALQQEIPRVSGQKNP